MQTIPRPSSTKEDKQLWRRWHPWLIVALVVIGALAVLALTLVVLPPWLVRAPVSAGFVDRVKAENDARGNLVAGLGVLAVLTGAIIGFLNFRESQRQNLRSLELSRRGQVSERFSKAIEQLGQSGEDRVDVRIGAIYSLEQIARDSPDELHGPIMETLTAFLRGHSGPPIQQSSEERVRLRADFQAIATALSRRDWQRDKESLDLKDVDLRRSSLADAYLEGADLRGAHLEGANLAGAHLKEADLRGAHLEGAVLASAHLEGADLRNARMYGAFLFDAHLRNAYLDGTVGLTSDQLAAAASFTAPTPRDRSTP